MMHARALVYTNTLTISAGSMRTSCRAVWEHFSFKIIKATTKETFDRFEEIGICVHVLNISEANMCNNTYLYVHVKEKNTYQTKSDTKYKTFDM